MFTDEQLNEIIARTDEEFERFTKMDCERYKLEDRHARLAEIREHKPNKKDTPDERINYRLVQEWEMPQWIVKSVKEDPIEEDPTLYGLGKRKRGDVNYKDELSEAQFLKIVDAGDDPAAEQEKRRKMRLENPDIVFEEDADEELIQGSDK